MSSQKKTSEQAQQRNGDVSGARVIKKYPNRRLYDTATSTYITLADVKELVMQGEAFYVRDAKTEEDLTRSILLQIILEAESAGLPMFSEAMLANIIRYYGHTMQGFMGTFLENNIQMFIDAQQQLSSQLVPPMNAGQPATNPAQLFGQMQELMQKQTEQLFGVFGLKK